MEMIQLNCKAIYHPRQHLAVNERMAGTQFSFLDVDVLGISVSFSFHADRGSRLIVWHVRDLWSLGSFFHMVGLEPNRCID